MAVRLGFIPRSHIRTRSPNYRARMLDHEADGMEKEVDLLRRELQRAPTSEVETRAIRLQIEHVSRMIQRN